MGAHKKVDGRSRRRLTGARAAAAKVARAEEKAKKVAERAQARVVAKEVEASVASVRALVELPKVEGKGFSGSGRPRVRAERTADSGVTWHLPGGVVHAVPTREAALRSMGNGVYGRWARKAAEPTPQGLWAFLQLIPRDHESNQRWKLAPHHWEWQSACFLHREVNIIAPIGHGKTEQLSFARTAWEIGCDPRLRHVLASNTAEQAIRTVRAIRSLIEQNEDYRRVFPGIKRGNVWSDRAFTVERPNASDRNPTVQAVGLHGAVLGARADRLGLDDMDDLESTWTAPARFKAQEWTRTNLFSRLGGASQVRSVQTAWHPEDHAHSFKRMGMPTFRYALRRPDGTYLWPALWNAEREAKMRALLGETASARMLDSIPRTGELGRFKEEWVHTALLKGLGRRQWPTVRADNGEVIVVGVDLAVGQGQDSDLCAFVTVLCDHKGTRHLLNVESGRFAGPDIVRKLVEHSRRYPGAIIVVENNAAQDYILQFAAQEIASIIPFTTGRQKADPRFGVESLATEMFNGKWAIPCSAVSPGLPLSYDADPEVRALVGEMFDYQPSAHTGDRLMALWFAREGITRGAGIVENVQLWRGG